MPHPSDPEPQPPQRAGATGPLSAASQRRAASGPLQEAARRRSTGGLPGSTGGLKRPATGGLKAGKPGTGELGRKKGKTGHLKGKGGTGALGKRRKKKPKSFVSRYLPQLIGAGTLLGVLGGIGLVAATVIKPAPEPSAVAPARPRPADALPRPPLASARVPDAKPPRPGLAAHPPDSVFAARATDLAAEPAAAGLVKAGVATVFADGAFRPAEPVTRAEAWSWLYGAVMAQTVPGEDPLKPVKRGFPAASAAKPAAPDVPADYWAAPVLATLEAAGWLPGGALHPEAGLSRRDLLSWASAWVPGAPGAAPAPGAPAPAGAAAPDPLAAAAAVPGAALDAARQAAGAVEGRAAEANAAAGQPSPAELAFRKADYTDYAGLSAADRALVDAWYGSPERARWMAAAFPRPTAPGAFPWARPVTRGELARFLGAASEALGAAL